MVWNHLSNNIRCVENLKSFKSYLRHLEVVIALYVLTRKRNHMRMRRMPSGLSLIAHWYGG